MNRTTLAVSHTGMGVQGRPTDETRAARLAKGLA
jgi:hypothetical protein